MADQLSAFLSSNEYIEFIENQSYHDIRLIKGLDSSDLPYEHLIEQNTAFQMQLLLRRSKSLFNAINNSIVSFNFIQLVLCIRAHYEVVGSIGYLLCNLKKYINGEMDIKDIDELLGRMNLGNKQKMKLKEQLFEPINVLSMIDIADKMLNEQCDNKKCILRDSYNWLSEFCHPNSLGLIYTIKEFENRKVVFSDNSFTQKEFRILGYANISFPLFFSFYDDIDGLIKSRTNIPKILMEV